MSTISTLPSSIVSWLNEQSSLEGIKFLTEYPPQYKAVPLRKPIVSVGLKRIGITDHFTDNGEGVLVRDEYCRTAEIEVVLSIHVPFSMGGSECHEVFTSVVDCLTFSSDLNIVNSHCDNISSDRDTDALVMNAYITVISDFCPAEEVDDNFHSFLDKELLCGSHIRDTDIHITSEERTKWNTLYYAGSYTGTGADTRTVNLGYKPAFLFVFSMGHFLVEHSSADDSRYVYSAVLSGDACSKGIESTSTGFKVYNNSRATSNAGTLKLNELGITYSFFAVKNIQ